MLWAVLYHDMSQDSVITIMIVNIFETIAQLYLLAMHYLSAVPFCHHTKQHLDCGLCIYHSD